MTGSTLRDDAFLEKNLTMEDLHAHAASQAGKKGTIIEIVEEALKWRLEAYTKKQAEVIDDLAIKVTATKRQQELVSSESTNEFMELKNQIVDAAADVLL